tara:strand:- start:774 stop:1754 length:981 start_codon:yes stop_codon:yes gene_type:complete
MKESEIRDQHKLSTYQKLVDLDIKKFFYNKKNFKNINYKKWGCGKVKKIFEKKNFSYFQCINSKTIFANPRPKPKILEEFYSKTKSSNYWLNQFFLPKVEARKNKIIKPRVKFFISNFKKYKNKRILDVGAGLGLFLIELKKKWPNSKQFAIEPSHLMAEKCRSRNIKVFESTIEKIDVKSKKFDAITCFELFEHLYDPKFFLTKIYKLLNKNGIFYFTTLNGMGFDIQMLGKNSNSIYPPYHINFFNPKSIEVLLKKIGFKIIFIDTPGELDLSIVENNQHLLTGEKKDFIKFVTTNTSKKYRLQFQKFLKDNKLSSHMRIVAKK